MTKKINVIKASGVKEEFSLDKLKNSLTRANATHEEINAITEAMLPKLYEGITTKKIYSEAFRLLRGQSKIKAARYYLKKGLMDFGPTGFPFERFVGEIYKHLGYSVQVGTIIQGKCVTHEIDVIAEKNNEILYVECKYRNQSGFTVDVKTPLYIFSRFQDVLDNGLLTDDKTIFTGSIATNTKFTDDALSYGNCKGLKMLSWNYPKNNSLKDIVDKSGLYPLTCLTSLTKIEKQFLLENNYVLVNEIYKNENLLRSAGIKDSRLKLIYSEGAQLCQLSANNKMQ
jgi:hypothetical protein